MSRSAGGVLYEVGMAIGEMDDKFGDVDLELFQADAAYRRKILGEGLGCEDSPPPKSLCISARGGRS